jgi:hypothetical protein
LFEGFEGQEVQEFEQQQSFMEGKFPLMHSRFILYNMHLIQCIYFIACINLDGFVLRMMTSVLLPLPCNQVTKLAKLILMVEVLSILNWVGNV